MALHTAKWESGAYLKHRCRSVCLWKNAKWTTMKKLQIKRENYGIIHFKFPDFAHLILWVKSNSMKCINRFALKNQFKFVDFRQCSTSEFNSRIHKKDNILELCVAENILSTELITINQALMEIYEKQCSEKKLMWLFRRKLNRRMILLLRAKNFRLFLELNHLL